MEPIQAVLFGILQGFTEFLPVSSSGHLELLRGFFDITEPSMTFDIVLHLGTLLAVFVVFWGDIFALIKKPFQKMTFLLVIGTLPLVVATILFKPIINALFEGSKFLPFCFIVTGILLIIADTVRGGTKDKDEISYLDSLVIGFFQLIGLPPGVSRSGSTITGALMRGLNRETAAKFSFLLSIPAILGAAVYEILKAITSDGNSPSGISTACMLAGFAASALSGYLAIRFMLALIKKAKLKYFSAYVFILAAILIVSNFI